MEIPEGSAPGYGSTRGTAPAVADAKESAGANTGEFAKGCKCRKLLRYSAKGKQ